MSAPHGRDRTTGWRYRCREPQASTTGPIDTSIGREGKVASLLTSTLGAPTSALGLIEGISDGAAGIARVAGGAPADNPHGRRAITVGGYATTAVFSAATARPGIGAPLLMKSLESAPPTVGTLCPR